ncbi:MAG: LPS export ABC transporter periplasmic protein LptC [Thermodesulfobacteriaceae bacterium]|nr:LPS export ABC transporter periplasmic protein LptC [Thermodesulfobacteriaceae bacterium]
MGRGLSNLFIAPFLIFLIVSLSFSQEVGFKIKGENLEYNFFKISKNKIFALWKLRAKELIQKEDFLIEVTEFNLVNEEKNLQIKGLKGFYFPKEKKFVFKNKVELKTSQYGEAFTEELIFYPEQNLIISEGEVILRKRGVLIRGKGLVYEVDTGNFQIKEKTRAQFTF